MLDETIVGGLVLEINSQKILGRNLHLSTFQLNVCTFCGIRWVFAGFQ